CKQIRPLSFVDESVLVPFTDTLPHGVEFSGVLVSEKRSLRLASDGEVAREVTSLWRKAHEVTQHGQMTRPIFVVDGSFAS
ncbi:hypothetical protein, partial [Acinetobacter baumannii]|uniref:hypothetical protein n=1 Tax=Acinetobacter baumannii TaxID=470 RepID=UPI0013D7B976